MKIKKHLLLLLGFFLIVNVNVSAQGFLKKLADGIEKVGKQVENVNQILNEVTGETTTEQPAETQQQTVTQQETQAVQNTVSNQATTSIVRLPTSQRKTDWEKRNLKGKVKSIVQKTERTNQNNTKETYSVSYTFTSDGMLQSVIHKNANGAILGKIECTYDASGKLTKKVVDTSNGIPDEILKYYKSNETFKYNTKGLLYESYDAVNKYKTQYSYNMKGFKIKETYVFDSKVESDPSEYTYDVKGNLTGVSSRGGYAYDSYAYDQYNNLTENCGDGYCTKSKYNELGDAVEDIDTEYDDVVSKKASTYQYDAQNNWTSKIEKESGNFGNIATKITRVISYY